MLLIWQVVSASNNSSEHESDIRIQLSLLIYKYMCTSLACACWDGHSLYGTWFTYIFAAGVNVNVHLFLTYITLLFFYRLCNGAVLVISDYNHIWYQVFLHTPHHISNACPKISRKISGLSKMYTLIRDKWERTIIIAWVQRQSWNYQCIKTLLTIFPQTCQIVEVTKCFAAFIASPKIFYVTQHNPNQLYLIQSVVIPCKVIWKKQ